MELKWMNNERNAMDVTKIIEGFSAELILCILWYLMWKEMGIRLIDDVDCGYITVYSSIPLLIDVLGLKHHI